MSLIFICPNCDGKYKAVINIRLISYENNGAKHTLEAEDDICYSCQEEAKEAGRKAEQEALNKRKKINK